VSPSDRSIFGKSKTAPPKKPMANQLAVAIRSCVIAARVHGRTLLRLEPPEIRARRGEKLVPSSQNPVFLRGTEKTPY
jgi:hypothetical protein